MKLLGIVFSHTAVYFLALILQIKIRIGCADSLQICKMKVTTNCSNTYLFKITVKENLKMKEKNDHGPNHLTYFPVLVPLPIFLGGRGGALLVTGIEG